jgi:general nucleoside transport system permease protein
MIDFLVNWITSTPSFAVPYALAALGLIVSEKAGVLSLGAEGFMLVGAMVGAGSILTLDGHPAVAMLAAALAAAAFSMVFAAMVVTLRVSQVISGLTMVFLAQGLTGLISAQQGWTNRPLGGSGILSIGSLIGIPQLERISLGQDMMVYVTLLIFVLVRFLLTRTMVGLKLRAVGSGTDAADAAGVNISVYRYSAIAFGAALVGLAGGYLSVGIAKIWVDGMAGGRGWISIALVIFARWQPRNALLGAILFGGIEALIPRIAAVGLHVPEYFVLMTPYLATLAVMVWTSLRHRDRFDEPAALGQPYLREERR